MSDEQTATPAAQTPAAPAPETPPAPPAPTEAQLVAKAHVALMHLHQHAVALSALAESAGADPASVAAGKATVKALRDVANKACDAAGM